MPADHLPPLVAVSLTGRRVRLPDDLAGAPALLLFAFQRWHQEVVAGWMPPLVRLTAEFPGFEIAAVSVMSRYRLPARPLIDAGLGRALRDPALRARTLTAYVDVDRLAADLGQNGTQNVALRLLDPAGRVSWAGRGVYDSDQVDALRGALAALDGNAGAVRGDPP